MGKIKWPVLVILIILVICISAFLILNKEDNEGTNEGEPVQTDLVNQYYIEDGCPPKLSALIENILKDAGFSRAENEDAAQITVLRISPVNSNIHDEALINLYQIWGVTLPFEEAIPKGMTIGDVSELIDSENPSELLGEFYPISVSPETNASGKAKLVTISEIHSYERFIGIDDFRWPIDLNVRDVVEYPLILQVAITSRDRDLSILQENEAFSSFISEYDYRTSLPNEKSVTTIIKTGTSVTGGPGWELCERVKGRASYPIEEVQDTLYSADIAIISNETSFVDGCSQPAGTTSFCGKPSYIENIIDLGVDIISLTGNHMCDYGKASFENMLATYRDSNISYFGSGDNEAEAWEPLYIETEAGTIAFIGYNMMGPGGVIATEDGAGVAYYDSEKFTSMMEEADDNADLVWVDTHLWPEYGTTASEDQITLSREAIDLGADIVTGVSSHEIQGMTFYKNAPIFYGLGNFLFDQMWSTETRQGMVLEVVLFEGKIVDIELMPTLMYDYCQPRFLEGEAKDELLDYFFSISDI